MKMSLTLLAATSALIALAGCAGMKEEVKSDADSANSQIAATRDTLRASILKADQKRVALQIVGKPYLAGNSTPLARDVSLPDLLRRPVPVTAMISKSPIDLGTALQNLSDATNLTITATSDALLPPSAFGPKLAGANSPVMAPARVVLNVVGKPLWNILDDIARQASVSWRPTAVGAEFYRVETRVFTLSAIPQTSSSTASLGRNGGANTAFDSQSKSTFESKDQNPIKALKTSIDALLSISGVATISQESQTLVVTDAKEPLDRIDAFVKEQNRAFSRRVRVLIETIEVTDKNSSEFGVDWTLLQNTATSSLNITPLTSLVDSQVAGVSLASTSGTGAGSTALVNALNEIGVVVNRRSFPLLTTSGRPVTQALRNTFNYIDQVQTTSLASSTTTATAPTVTQKEETVGTFLTIVPTAKPDGTVFLSVSFDVTSLASLVPFTMGTGATSVTVQQKSIDGNGVIQEVPVRSGQTVVIGGIENNSLQNTERRLGPGAPLIAGGSDATKVTKARTIILVTAVIEEGV